jgi:hypothetical protein
VNLLQTLIALEEMDAFHMGRLLVLLKAFSGQDNRRKIKGLTKLVKLDFLLRYPVYLEQALKKRGVKADIFIAEHERRSVESKMIRYKYGPWDPRYRRFINLLVARGLACVEIEGRTVNVGLTEAGVQLATVLSKSEEYRETWSRAKTLKSHLDLAGTNLMRRIYEWFPEIVDLRLGEAINA